MRIKYLPGEHLQEASEIDDPEEFITAAKALQFFGARTLLMRGEFIPITDSATVSDANLEIEATFDKLINYMLTGIERSADGYGPMSLNPRHTNFVQDSLHALSKETPETLAPHEQVYAQYIASAQYVLDHLEVEGFPESAPVVADLVSVT